MKKEAIGKYSCISASSAKKYLLRPSPTNKRTAICCVTSRKWLKAFRFTRNNTWGLARLWPQFHWPKAGSSQSRWIQPRTVRKNWTNLCRGRAKLASECWTQWTTLNSLSPRLWTIPKSRLSINNNTLRRWYLEMIGNISRSCWGNWGWSENISSNLSWNCANLCSSWLNICVHTAVCMSAMARLRGQGNCLFCSTKSCAINMKCWVTNNLKLRSGSCTNFPLSSLGRATSLPTSSTWACSRQWR